MAPTYVKLMGLVVLMAGANLAGAETSSGKRRIATIESFFCGFALPQL